MFRKTACVAALAASLPSQPIIPAKAGLVSYADEAYIDDRSVEISPTHFFVVNENAVLRTGAGRAEVLLGPCAAMWIDENSSFRMISTALSDIRIEVLTGSAIVAAGAIVKGTKLTLLLKTSVASVDQKGAYRFDSEPPRVQVLAGRTTVQRANQGISVTAGRWLRLDALAHVRVRPAKSGPTGQLEQRPGGFLGAPVRPADGECPRAGAVSRYGCRQNRDMGEARKLSGLNTMNTQTSLPPVPNSSPSGCGVEAWRVTTH
jgi:hypothetical protein